jgi:hypothetical protein
MKLSGPSEEDIARSREAADRYRQQMELQQQTMRDSLADQIAQANAETERLRKQYEAEAAAAEKDAMRATYAATATQTATPATAKTTTAVTAKQKPKGTLRIDTAGLPSGPGTGLNIGV